MNIALKIRDGLVEVDNKPYSVSELYVGGVLRGEMSISKNTGIWGEVVVEDTSTITYEYPGILIIGAWSNGDSIRVDIVELRKSFTVKYSSKQREASEVKLIFNSVKSHLITSFTPRRIILRCRGVIELIEEPFKLLLITRSRE